ncbi:hypothetical protein V6N11_055268 [Hibiscus sabdariffa]|uniref:Uncharacterized protein n=1 Tax=Hibiscus sabdariffa TaxID=183260 RepID=A0ABR2PET8_9ROSI
MIRLLLNSSVEKNLTNMDNSTPLDILPKANNEEARNILESAGGLRADDLPNFPTLPAFLQTNITPFESMHKAADRQRKNLPSNTRSALLVVAGLTLTATYNASLNPPGGISPGPRNSCTGGFLSSSSNNSTADYLLKSFTVEDHPLGKSVMTPGIFLTSPCRVIDISVPLLPICVHDHNTDNGLLIRLRCCPSVNCVNATVAAEEIALCNSAAAAAAAAAVGALIFSLIAFFLW